MEDKKKMYVNPETDEIIVTVEKFFLGPSMEIPPAEGEEE